MADMATLGQRNKHVRKSTHRTACDIHASRALIVEKWREADCAICRNLIEEEYSLTSSIKKLLRLLRRDSFLCGRHVGGCRKEIGYDEVVSGGTISLDHILSKSFAMSHKERMMLKKSDWNLQPMHESCNNQKGGSLGVDFLCNCHYTYVNKDDSVELYYYFGKKWNRIMLFNAPNRVGRQISKPGLFAKTHKGSHSFVEFGYQNGDVFLKQHMVSGEHKDRSGVIWRGVGLRADDPRDQSMGLDANYGHALRIYPPGREQYNATEMARVEGLITPSSILGDTDRAHALLQFTAR